MNKNFRSIIKNLTYSFSANALMMIFSVISVVFFPKILGLKEYGIWQLYLFYFSFCGFLPFGWLDGIYLRYGGRNFEKLNGKLLSLEFLTFSVFILIELIIVYVLSNMFIEDKDKIYVLNYLIITLIFYLPFSYLRNLLQLSNRITDFARLIFIDRLIFMIGVITSIIFIINITNEFMISDSIAKFVTLVLVIYYCFPILKNIKLKYYKKVYKDILSNIYVGYNLMFANIASILILGVIRWGISQEWDIVTFGKISLTFSICNFLVVFINSASIVLFPVIKNISVETIKKTYSIFNFSLTLFLLVCLFFYYPLKEILLLWLPKYADSLIYMSILFPICIFESKMALLIATYLKALRKEKILLKVNSISLIFSIILTFFSACIFHILDLTVFCIIFVIAFRNIIAELFMNNILNINSTKEMLQELLLIIIFISSNYFIKDSQAFFIYLISFIIYLVYIRNNIKVAYKNIIINLLEKK